MGEQAMRHGLRWWGGLAAFLLILSGISLLSSPAQPPNKGRPPEEEETGRPKNKKLKNLDPDQTESPQRRPVEPPAGDLSEASRNARNDVVRKLLQSLAVPYDVLVIPSTFREQRIKPIPVFLVDGAALPSGVQITPLDPKEKPATSLHKYKPYEQLAMDAVQQFLARNLEKLPEADPNHLSRREQLDAAELVLTAVGRYHASARRLKEREGDGWSRVEVGLAKELFGVQMEQMKELGREQNWDSALTLGRRLWDTYLVEEDQARIAEPLAALLEQAGKDPGTNREKMREARQRLVELVGRYPNNKTFVAIQEKLEKQAQELFRLFRQARDRKEYASAQDLLQQAEETWPRLKALRDHRVEVSGTDPVLRVGVRHLPKFLSPRWATTDSELRAVELLFESLVKVSPDGQGVLRYQPGLSHGRPALLARGRQFQLPRNAFWSNDKPLTPGDVRYSVRQLKQGLATGRAPAWGQLLDEVRAEDDPFRVNVLLNQGYLEPLSLMTFKILPHPSVLDRGLSADKEEFALDPVGSGPFKFAGERRNDRARPYIAFTANLNYASRTGKQGQPRIREVQFYAYDKDKPNPIEDLKNLDLHLLLDLNAGEATALEQQAAGLSVKLEPPQASNRRVYFLAVNHRNLALQNPDLRLALARGINREAILNLPEIRGLIGRKIHKALNSLFPADSWALSPALKGKDRDSLDPHDFDVARTLAQQALTKLNLKKIELTVKYPQGDAATKLAVDAICQQMKGIPGLELTPKGCDPYQLRKDVEEEPHDYELAYYHYDFPDDTFSLLPLLGQHGLAGSGNYLGYDGKLTVPLQKLQNLREFVKVRGDTQEIHHIMVTQEMPVIPLWQLDPLMAIRKNLEKVPFDPWLVFTDIDQWQFTGK
jgi:ABC-type oligopeptide transport system substrate-binding subunit